MHLSQKDTTSDGGFRIQVVGLMSGTSLDGLDVCCATFWRNEAGRWSFHIDATEGYSYDEAKGNSTDASEGYPFDEADLRYILGTGAQQMSAREFVAFHSAYGAYLGRCVNDFLQRHDLHPDLIASHGHTIFHEPDRKVMFQIGDGAAIAATTGIATVSDFRRLDIMLGGQGAPLVPIGDRLLFADYTFCLNLGGFSNISYEVDGRRIAFDISPVNYVINHYCRQVGLDFDRDGEIARRGTVDSTLLGQLNALDYYRQAPPKSLGREWVERYVFPLMDASGLCLEDRLRTFYEHVAQQLGRVIGQADKGPRPTLLATGGGTYNTFLMERLRQASGCQIVTPSAQIIEYKEALIFAFLGALYMAGEASCLRSVTGARHDNIGGMLFKV